MWILCCRCRCRHIRTFRAFHVHSNWITKKRRRGENMYSLLAPSKTILFFSFRSQCVCVFGSGDTVHSNSYSSTCSLTLNTYRTYSQYTRSKYCFFSGWIPPLPFFFVIFFSSPASLLIVLAVVVIVLIFSFSFTSTLCQFNF